MTDILCRWLNEDVRLEPKLSKPLTSITRSLAGQPLSVCLLSRSAGDSFAEQFSNGYLFGEVLHRHGLQTDFPHFSSGRLVAEYVLWI